MPKDGYLPPRPGEIPVRSPIIRGMPFMIYIQGNPIEIDRTEAIDILSQLSNLFAYEDRQWDSVNKDD